MSTESLQTCSNNVGIAIGGLILVEGIIAAVAAVIIIVICWLLMRYIDLATIIQKVVEIDVACNFVKIDTW